MSKYVFWLCVSKRKLISEPGESEVAVLGRFKFHVCFCVSCLLGEIKCGHVLSLLFPFKNASRVNAVNNGWPL